jgi:aryl-alcohol dehydrogenase-like predicted oxidoreductase
MTDASLPLPRLSLGAMTFGAQVAPDEAQRMVDRAREVGVTLFDTADSYQEGASETVLGRCLRGVRDEVLVASKVGRPVGSERGGLAPDWIRSSIDRSLSNLGIDHLDLYYLHQPDPIVPIEDSLGAMQELIVAGKIRAIGVSNYAAWQIADLEASCARNGWHTPAVSQVLYNAISRRLEDEYAAFAAEHGLSTTVYNPLAGGLLTGKHRPGVVPQGGRFALDRYRDRYWADAQFDAVERLAAVADEVGTPLIELALRWLLSRDVVDSVLLGASSEQQLATNLDACSRGSLSAEILEEFDEVWVAVGGAAPNYNR